MSIYELTDCILKGISNISKFIFYIVAAGVCIQVIDGTPMFTSWAGNEYQLADYFGLCAFYLAIYSGLQTVFLSIASYVDKRGGKP